MYRDLVFRPDVDTTITQPVGAPEFLDLFMRDNNLVAGYVPFKGVAPADVDPGGSESPAAEAALAEYLRGRRESGDIERARQRLTQQGFPFGGV